MLRSSSLCDIEEDFARPPEEQRVEVFCNRVAAAALVPEEEFLGEPVVAGQPARAIAWEEDAIVALAHRYSVSREVIVRRFLTLGRTTEAFYQQKRREYREQWEAAQRARQESGGPESPAKKVISTQSQTFIRLVLESYHQGHITLSDVSSYLGVRVKHLPKIEQAVLAA